LIEVADNSNTGATVQIFFSCFGVLVKTDTFQPSGFVSSGFEGQGKRCNGVSLATEEDFRVVAKVASQDKLIDHGTDSFRGGLNWDFTDTCEIGLDGDIRY
jgi:hypothetical protein